MGVWGSNGPLKAVWVGGVQITGLVHLITEENENGPSLIRKKHQVDLLAGVALPLRGREACEGPLRGGGVAGNNSHVRVSPGLNKATRSMDATTFSSIPLI